MRRAATVGDVTGELCDVAVCWIGMKDVGGFGQATGLGKLRPTAGDCWNGFRDGLAGTALGLVPFCCCGLKVPSDEVVDVSLTSVMVLAGESNVFKCTGRWRMVVKSGSLSPVDGTGEAAVSVKGQGLGDLERGSRWY